MKYLITLLFIVSCISLTLSAQTGKIRGTVKDGDTGELLFGATVLVEGTTTGTVTDFNGNFELTLPYGKATLKVSYVGYEPKNVDVSVSASTQTLNISLKTIVLNEVMVVADFARTRETPVAFSNILPAKLEEELAGRDIPMILNSTPGVYATQQGGGEGDARITIRGFNQRNVAVMLDGVPVNDMENGWVYWSNWFGLDMITRTIQVQRGLGASRLGIPSVGGTMNIMTQGISSKPGVSIKQEITDYGNYRTSFGATSGKAGNWGVTVAGSYKWGSGYVDVTDNKGFFYYLKIERRLGKHLLSLTGFGAPQQHYQRSYKTSIALIDSAYAIDVAGVPDSLAENPLYWPKFTNLGIRYNQHWGYLNRWTLDSSGDTIWSGEEKLNEKLNYYHKPQFSLKDTWTVNDKLFISNTLYLSIGNGGGTGLYQTQRIGQRPTPQIPLQTYYDANARTANYTQLNGGRKSSNFIQSSVNNHFWYGMLSSAEYQIDENYNLSGGVDLRSYVGEHYREVYDLLGGDFVIMGDYSPINKIPYTKRLQKVGDKISYHNDGNVRWSGLFGQLEFTDPNYSWFLSSSVSRIDYRRVDYFAPYYYNDTLVEFGAILTGPNADPTRYFPYILRPGNQRYYIDLNDAVQKNKYSPWKNFWGYTVKAGFNYNVTEQINAFINAGNLSRAPRFNNVFANNTQNTPKNLKNEEVYAVEIGSTYSSPVFSCNLNGYFTYWNNKPLDNLPFITDPDTDERIYLNITGIAARHAGVEFDFVYKPIKQLEIQGLVSLGDWIYNSADSVVYRNEITGQVIGTPVVYDAKGVHVGDAAQTQLGGAIRYDIIKGLFVQLRGTYFDRYYADFEPSTLSGANKGRESWVLPAYTLFDFTAGYNFKITQKQTASLSFNILNIFDKIYISDAKNNSTNLEYQSLNNFDAHSAEVFFGMGRRINLAMKINF